MSMSIVLRTTFRIMEDGYMEYVVGCHVTKGVRRRYNYVVSQL